MSNDFHATAEKKMTALESWLLPMFSKLPHLPGNAKLTITKIAPWFALIFGALGLLGILSTGAIASILTFSFFGGGLMQISWTISILAAIIAAIFQLLAYQPLTKNQKKGWNYLFYGTVLTAVAALVDLLFGYGSGAVQTIVGSFIGLWLLFEIRSSYR
ncbi:hypothetical protein EXS65_03355 [Candidatus Peribacteria bacterium]|nr:hypothetical protein [Candidatus Peribacteria bacterium]